MYNELFELEQMPFANTADPAFFFKTAEHEEALAALFYGITQRRGVVVITGPSGSGKTLLAHMLVEQLRPEAQVALLLHTPENGHDLISSLCRELGVRHRSTQPTGELVERLRQFLSERFLEDKSVVAVVDDAQNMNVETMEHLRMLSNLEKENAKLLQIVLLGQPDLVDKLSLPQMHQVCQRVFCHRQIGPLAHDQTRAYIRHRLRIAGVKEEAIFSDEAIDLIHDRSGGLPRLINQICDNAMLAAYAIGQKTIDRELVFNCVRDMLGLHPVETGSTAAASSPPATQTATTAPQAPIAWPATACIPPVITTAAGELDEAVRHGAEIAGRLSEINRTAQNHSGELKSLLTRAETLAAKLTESNQASTVGHIELLARLKDVNSVIGEAGRLTDRLSTGGSEAARLADRLDAIARRAESMAHTLEAAGPQAAHELDEAVRKAQTAATDVARTFAELNCTMSAAAELRVQMLGVLNETNAIRESLRQTGSALEDRSADARGLIDSLEQAQRTLEAPMSQSGILSDRLAEQIPQAGNAAKRLEEQSKTLPSLLKACDESVAKLRSVRAQIPAEIQHLREASEQARNDLAAIQAVVGIVSNQTAQADSTTKACVQQNEALQSILQQARELDRRLSTRQVALPSLLEACDNRLAAMRDWQNEIPNHIQKLAEANEQARNDLAALEAAARTISERTVEATTATQVCSEENNTLQAILPHVQELRHQLSVCQEELPALLHSCNQTLADMRGWQDSIPHQIEELIEASRQAREELGTLQATVTAASTQATQTDAATRACSKESETLRSILPTVQDIHRKLLDQQTALPSLLTACEETLAELQQREDEIPDRIRRLTEASERARNDLIALQAAGQAVSAQTAQAEAISKVCAKENESLRAILPQAQVLNEELSSRQQALPSLLNACDEAIAEISHRQEELPAALKACDQLLVEMRHQQEAIPKQIQQLTDASRQAHDNLTALQNAARTVAEHNAEADATTKACAKEHAGLRSILPQVVDLNRQLSACQDVLPTLLCSCDQTLAEMREWQDKIPIRIQELAEASDRIRDELTALQAASQEASEQAEQTDATAKACAGENATLKSILPQARELSLRLSNQQHALPAVLDACNEALAQMREWQNEIPARVRQLTEAGERARTDLAILQAATQNAERQAARTDASTQDCAKEHEILKSILTHARELNQQLSARQEAATPLLIACDEKLVELRGRQEETPEHVRQLATASERASKELASLQSATQAASVQTAQTDAAIRESIRQNESLQSILPQARELNGQLAEQQEALPVLLDACEATLAEMQHRQEGIPAQLRQLAEAREHTRQELTALEAITEAASAQSARADAATHACTQATQALELILPQANGLNEQLADHLEALPPLLNACDTHARDLTGRLGEIPGHLKQIDEHRQSLAAAGQKLEIATEAATNKAGEVETILAACTDRIDDLGRIIVQASSLNERLDEARQSAASTSEICELRMAELTGRLEHIPTQIANLSTACERADELHKSLETDTRTARSQIDETHELSRRIESQSQTMETQLRAIQATGTELSRVHADLKQSFSDEAIHSIRTLDAQVRASLTEAVLRQTELTASTRSAEAVREDMVQRCALAKELAETLASVNEQTDIKAARATEVSERCAGRADEMTWLLGESDRAADNLADACSEAGILNDEWTQRIAMLAEENRQAFVNTQQLERTSQQAEEIRGLLTRRAIAAVRQVTAVQEQALRQTEETDLAADRARQVLDGLGHMKQMLDDTYGDQFIEDIESRRMQLVDSLEIAARRREELIAAGANADALRQRLSESCDLLDNRLAESACQGQRIHQDLVEAVEAARVQATVAAELSERLVGQNDAVCGRIDEAKAVEADLDRLRAELVSATIPQAVAALRAQQQETQAAIAEAEGRTADLKAISQEALDRDTRLAAAIREAGEARETLENTSGEIRGQLDELRVAFEQTSRSVDARIDQLNAEAETVMGRATERIARQSDEISEQIARLDEFADTVTRVSGEDLTRKREEIKACMAQLGKQAETVAHVTGEQIARIRDEAAQITARFDEQIAATGRLSSEIDDMTNRLSSRMAQADQTATEIAERTDRKIGMLAGETDLATTLLAQLNRIQAEIKESLESDAMRALEARRAELATALNEAGSRATVLAAASSEAEARATQLAESNRQAVETVDSLRVSASHAVEVSGQLDAATATAVEKTGQAEELLSRMVGQVAQLTTRIEDAEGNARRLESLRQALDRIVSPGFARTLEEKCSLLESLLTRTADEGAAIEAAARAAEANAMAANESAHLAGQANKTLAHTLESARQETTRLEETRAQVESRIDPLRAAIQLADEKTEHLCRITETAEQVRNDYGEKLKDLVERISQADVESRRIEELLQQAPQFQSNLAEQVGVASELKREIDRATRRLANERRLAESAMEQLHDLRMEHLALASGAEFLRTARTPTTAEPPHNAVVRTAHTAFDALTSLREAVAGHEPRMVSQRSHRLDAAHEETFTCGRQG